MVISSYLSASYDNSFSLIRQTFFYYRKQCSSWCFQKLFIPIMVYPARSPETLPPLMPSCWFIFAGCDFLIIIMFRQTAEMVLRKKINKKDYFLTLWWSIEIVPEISLPPCTLINAWNLSALQPMKMNTRLPMLFLLISKRQTPGFNYSTTKKGQTHKLNCIKT